MHACQAKNKPCSYKHLLKDMSEGAPVSLLNLRTAYLSCVMLPREGGMVPKMALLVMSKFCRLLALPMVEGMVPVSWLLYSVRTCSLDVTGSALGMDPVRLLLPAPPRRETKTQICFCKLCHARSA